MSLGRIACIDQDVDAVLLHAPESAPDDEPHFIDVTVLPGRGMNVFKARAHLPGLGVVDLLHSPSIAQASHQAAFSCGGAILLPFANRIRGRLTPDEREIETRILDRTVRLPANWHGKHPGAEKCAMHGLMLDAHLDITSRSENQVEATLDAGDFHGHWMSKTVVRASIAIHAAAIDVRIDAQNVGADVLPVGIGWHPYFRIPSGDRPHARVLVPARRRAVVDNYDDVFPTGELLKTACTPYDFSGADGGQLGSMYFDDMFVDLQKTPEGQTTIVVMDPTAHYVMRLIARSPHVTAIQMYAPPDQAFVVLEPQFNLADPFGPEWRGTDTGMVLLAPGEHVEWSVRWDLVR